MIPKAFLLFTCLWATAISFHRPFQNRGFSSGIFASSYDKMLEQARLRKQEGQSRALSSVAPAHVAPTKKEPIEISKSSKLEGFPFNDHIYNQLKFVIAKLTGKIKSDITMTPDELVRFETAIEEIIADSSAVSFVEL
jgi:hypothetical protein